MKVAGITVAEESEKFCWVMNLCEKLCLLFFNSVPNKNPSWTYSVCYWQLREESLLWVYQLIKITSVLSIKYILRGIKSQPSRNWLEKCKLCFRSYYFSVPCWQFNGKSVGKSAWSHPKTWLILLYVGRILTVFYSLNTSIHMDSTNITARVAENFWI